MLYLVCIARERFFFFGRVHVISTGPITAVQTEGQGLCSLIEQRMKTPPTKLTSVGRTLIIVARLLNTDAVKRYLVVCIYQNNFISMLCVLWETRYSECRVLGI
ncbi:unnamed protein product, partial [Staurois parvus]